MAGCIAGCVHKRVATMVTVDDLGPQVVTKNRYTLVAQGKTTNEQKVRIDKCNEWLKKAQPQVFGDGGVPFHYNGIYGRVPESADLSWTVIFFPTLFLPMCSPMICENRYAVDVVDNPGAHASFCVKTRVDTAISVLPPVPMVCYLGNADFEGEESGCRKYVYHGMGMGGCVSPLTGEGGIIGYGEAIDDFDTGVSFLGFNSADAYGIAVSLKKMEDEGKIDVSRWRTTSEGYQSNGSSGLESVYLADFHRAKSNERQYVFVLKPKSQGVSLRELRNIQREVREMIRNDFAESFPSANRVAIAIDFSEYALENGGIRGVATVLPLAVLSFSYDKNTRRGTMRIRVDKNQLSDARKYIKRNIGSIVRDKNIALVAGEVPPSATFYMLDEEVKDGVLEIQFKAE